jgi:7-cyano-7-deazaguanine synthase
MSNAEPAIVLLSGGLDSATALAIARADGFAPLALSFRYGQRHAIELYAAEKIARALKVAEHRIIDVDLRAFGGSALTADFAVPKGRPIEQIGRDTRVPITYVPARNTIFLSFALAFAEVRSARHVYIGVNALDYSGYPDCRPEFIAAFEQLARVATKAGVEGRAVRIHAPLIAWTKEQIIRRGLELGVDYGLTRSCYDPDPAGRGCRRCDSCVLRLAAFAKIGVADLAPYVEEG